MAGITAADRERIRRTEKQGPYVREKVRIDPVTGHKRTELIPTSRDQNKMTKRRMMSIRKLREQAGCTLEWELRMLKELVEHPETAPNAKLRALNRISRLVEPRAKMRDP